MATRSLSPNRIAQKLREHRTAVARLAMFNARLAVKAQIRAEGGKVAHYTAREISVLAEVELQRNRAQFVAEAEHTIATWPGFARTDAANINHFGCSDIRCEIIVGYARVSTDGQSYAQQCAELRSAGAEKVFSEKISGAITDRPALKKAISGLGNGMC